MKQTFKIADIIIQIDSCIEYEMRESFEPFLVSNDLTPDVRIRIAQAQESLAIDGKLVYDDAIHCIYECEGIFYRETKFLSGVQIAVLKEELQQGEYLCYITPQGLERSWGINDVFAAVGFEAILLSQSAMLLHSSLINWNEKGIIFSAPSQTGKTTQAKLWEQYEQAEILNGDRSILRKKDGIWCAYGLPYAGSSCIYKNESVAISTIAILSQGRQNQLTPLSKSKAFKYLYSEMMCNSWNQAYVNRLMDLLEQLVQEVSVCYLTCRPDKDAVQILKNEVTRHND